MSYPVSLAPARGAAARTAVARTRPMFAQKGGAWGVALDPRATVERLWSAEVPEQPIMTDSDLAVSPAESGFVGAVAECMLVASQALARNPVLGMLLRSARWRYW